MKLLLLFLTSIAYSQTPQQLFLQSPPPPAINAGNTTIVGNLGNSTYYYWVIANYPLGAVLPTGSIKVVQAPTTLSSSNYVTVSWTAPQNVSYYSLLRTTTPTMPTGVCSCLVVDHLTNPTYNTQSSTLTSFRVPTGIVTSNGIIGIDMSTYYQPQTQFRIPVGDNVQTNLVTLGIRNIQASGPITTITVNVGGTGYAIGDTGQIANTCSGLEYTVDTVNAGVVTSVHVSVNITHCSGGTGVPTSVITGAGDGNLTVNITAPNLILPAASSVPRAITIVTDATSATDCTTGGSDTISVCYSDGTQWLSFSGSTATCGTILVCNNQANTYTGEGLQDFGNDDLITTSNMTTQFSQNGKIGSEIGTISPHCIPFATPFGRFGGSLMTTLGFGGEFVGTGTNDFHVNILSCYTGVNPAVYTIKIAATGTPDTFVWQKNSGVFSAPIAITTGVQTIADGLRIQFSASTTHTLGDKWIVPTRNGIVWAGGLVDGADSATSALAGLGAGNVTNGVHQFKISWTTNGGDLSPNSAGSVNVVDKTVNGQVTISNLNAPTDLLFTGWNVWATKAGGTDFYLADFIPRDLVGTTYTYNKADSSLIELAPSYLSDITSTATPCFQGGTPGVGNNFCAFQLYDSGMRFPLAGTSYYFDGYATGIFGTDGHFLKQFTGVTGQGMCWLSDNTPGHCTTTLDAGGACTCVR